MPQLQSSKWVEDVYLSTETRDVSHIRFVLIATMLMNFAATAVKMIAGLLTGSLSVVADSLDNLFDGLSNIVGLAGLYAAVRPPDADHPYGHRKFETLAALSIAALLFVTAWEIFESAWARLANPSTPDVNLWTGAAMIIGLIVQAITSWYELRQGQKLKSEMLIADAYHTRASILVSLSVLGGLVMIKLGYPWADPALAIVVALMIAKIGVDILHETLPVLVDRAAIPPEQIAAIVSEVPGVESFHRVRSRGARGSAAIDLHIRVEPEKTLLEANAVADEVRRRLLEIDTVNDVIVHFEAAHEAHDAADIAAGLRHLAGEINLTIHEMEISKVEGELTVDVHVGVDPALTLGQAHVLVDRFERQGRTRHPEIRRIHTHIELATTAVHTGEHVSSEIEERVRRAIHAALAGFPALSDPHHIHVRHNLDHPQGHYLAAGEHLNIAMHCVIAPETPVDEAHRIATEFERELIRRLSVAADITIHLEPPEHIENE
jgi:cation diffusion facilitator family transporter